MPVCSPVHPHVCGECRLAALLFNATTGSPPRVWGMPRATGAGLRPPRFTPTCVGNARRAGRLPHRAPVHPHVCGECCLAAVAAAPVIGSPPRVWGMLPARARRRLRVRFTPTCVGNACPPVRARRRTAVHPHVCGECSFRESVTRYAAGSPPRVWGMPHHHECLAVPGRFTPTCVGNARRMPRARHVAPVHPHVCGECARGSASMSPVAGSPPRVWGMRVRRVCPVLQQRFTPTCVGNAAQAGSRCRHDSVHPHVCGECL